MEHFVTENSIVRKIWGKSDTILLIFAGAAAEFALNKAVDWLYFTGRLPKDPIGRLFTTVAYARQIVFAERHVALHAIDKMSKIHSAVEESRGSSIPDWAYRDVLFMLIHYSIASYEVLEHKMTDQEKDDVYTVFYNIGIRMGIKELPPGYKAWLPVREQHLRENLEKSALTVDLHKQYKKHLGAFRYWILREAQILVVPPLVKQHLDLRSFSLLAPAVPVYKFVKVLKLDWLLKSAVLPPEHQEAIKQLDMG